jgi:hypothetical protein
VGLANSADQGGVSGAVGGAISGAEIGSIIPGVGTVLGGIVGGFIGLFSDPRLKKDIRKAGVSASGFPLYEFRYKNDPTNQAYEGVLSPDVQKRHPSAVHRVGGYDMVDYKAIGVAMRKIPGYADGGAFGGGMRIVGERGPELEVTGPSRIYSNKDTVSMLDNRVIVKAIEDLRKDMVDGQYAIARSCEKTARYIDMWDGAGMPKSRTT